VIRRLVKILCIVSLVVLLVAVALGTAAHFFPTSSTKVLSPTTQRQMVFSNGQFLIRQTQTIVHPERIEHSSHTIFRIGFWSIIPWTLIFPILWVRYIILKRTKPTSDPAATIAKRKSDRKSPKT